MTFPPNPSPPRDDGKATLPRFSPQQRSAAIFLAVVVALTFIYPLLKSHPNPDAVPLWGDAAAAQDVQTLLTHPQQVQAFTFGEQHPDTWKGDLGPEADYIGFHKITGGPTAVSQALARDLATALLDHANFQAAQEERCLNPGPAVRFSRQTAQGLETVEALVSLDCGTILVVHFKDDQDVPAADMLLSPLGRNKFRELFGKIPGNAVAK